MQISSIVDEALNHWFSEILNEVEISLPTKSSERVSLQKERNAWYEATGIYAPKSEYSVGFANIDPFLHVWISNYKKQNGRMPTLTDLKNDRPDFLPSRYVFVANGMGGMIAREYIQSADYNGNVDKILFIDTPHEGTGFADHALLSKDEEFMKRDISLSFMATAFPLITLLYTNADSRTLSDFYIPLLKNVMNIAAASSNLAASGKMNNHYFGSYSEKDGALWYLAQDADKRDLLYNNVRNQASSVKADSLIGRSQLLNTYGMLSSYDNPMYRIMYSYGMPTIGNGRRARADYLFQKKYHVDEKTLIDNIKSVYKKAVGTLLLDSLGLKDAIADAYAEQLGAYIDDKVRDIRTYNSFARYGGDVGEWLIEKIPEGESLASDALKGVTDFATNAMISFAVDYGVGALLEWIDIGGIIDDMPNWLVTFISTIAELAPQQLTEQFVSAFMSSYAPSYKGMDRTEDKCDLGDFSINPFKLSETIDFFKNVGNAGDIFNYGNCIAAGQKDFAQRLANYSVNFYDDGTFNVPSYSAFGGNVVLFSGSDIKRKSYPLHKMDAGIEYADLKANLLVSGAVETNRKIVDDVLGTVCDFLPKSYAMVCKAAQLLVNTGVIVGQNVETSYIFHSIDALEKSANLSLMSAVQRKNEGSVKLHSGISRQYLYTDLDMMMFEKPYMGLQMVVQHTEDGDKYIPLMLKKTSGVDNEIPEIPEIIDYNSLEKVFREKNGGSNEEFEISSVINFFGDVQKLKKKKLTTAEDYLSLPLKNDVYEVDENGVVTRRVLRYDMPNIVVKNFVEEYRFQVEDLRPDLLWSIAFDFNMDVQIYFERNQNNSWNTYIERNGRDRVLVEQGGESPVNEMGLFVFRPMRLVEAANEKIEDENKRFFPNKVQPEGPNLVSVTLTNAMGMSASQQFSFYFQAVLPLLTEGWPTHLQTVSSLKDIYITASNQGEPYKIVDAEVCLVKSENGVYSPALDNCITTKITEKQENFDQVWRIDAQIGDDLIEKLSDGDYVIQWKLKAEDEGGNVSPYNMNVSVTLDTKSPEFELVFPEKPVTNKMKQGSWAKIINKDNSSLRAVRVFAIPEGTSDTTWIKNLNGTGASEINLGWNLDMENLPQGKSVVYIQSVDYAEANVLKGLILQNLYSNDFDTVKKAWSELLEADGVSFVQGVNGVTMKNAIYIDNEVPRVKESSVKIIAEQFSKTYLDCPNWSRPFSGETVVNSSELVKLSFELMGNISSAAHDSTRIQIMFIDADQSLVKNYVVFHDFNQNSIFTFVEPFATRILDGKYTVVVNLTDAAGNCSGNIDLGRTVRVARAVPVVNSVLPAEPVYASADEVDAATYTVSSSEIKANRSSFACYQKIISSSNASEWKFIGNVAADKMADGEKVSNDYSLKDTGFAFENGRYTAIVGCFDGAGNFSSNSEPFSVGYRYPVLTYPTIKDGKLANDIIRISGIAPNPIVPNGNVQTTEYAVKWRRAGSSDWKTDGVLSTGKIASTMVNTLAFWDRNNVPEGKYELVLSVRGCKDADNPKCNWIDSDFETVELIATNNIQAKPSIHLTIPADGLVPGGNEAGIISSELLGVNDGSEWSMDMKIYVSDPYDASRMIVADQKYLDKMVISPFGGSTDAILPQGVSIWQDKDLWTIRVNDVLEPSDRYDAPSLVLHYTHSGLEFVDGVSADAETFYNADDPNQFAPEIEMAYAHKPRYNYTSEWSLEGKNAFELKFKATESFIVDLSSVKGVNEKLYCGTSGKLCSQYFPLLMTSSENAKLSDFAFSEVYVNLNSFKVDFPWNGLTAGGMYPSSPRAKVVAIATEKQPGARVVTSELPMLLKMGSPEIISNYSEADVGQFIVSSETNQENKFVRLGEVGYEFGLAGRNAKVSVTVKDSSNKVVKILMNNEPCVASAKRNAFAVSWDGVAENNFAKIDAGRYYFEVTAVDDAGNKATPRVYNFDIIHAGHLIAAPSGDGVNGSTADFKMEEAERDENGEYRFVGRADYILTMDADAQVLPEEKRTFEYYWDWSGVQYPAFYRANRFSLGIRRHRKSFPATLVTRLNSRQYYITSAFNLDKRCRKNSIKVQKVIFDEDENGGSFVIPKLSVSAGSNNTDHIIGWNEDGNHEYDINFEAKVFDIDDYDEIKKQIGGETVSYCESWEKRAGSKDYAYTENDITTKFKNAFTSSEHPNVLLWSYKKTFKYKSQEIMLDGGKEAVVEGCSPSESNGYLCEKTETFNPHEKMLSVSIEHVEGENFFGNNDFHCDYFIGKCSNHESATEIFAKVTFTVNDKYWNPEFGYSNLANKYVRFDHTNKALYDVQHGYYAKADLDTPIKNYYDGEKWIYNRYYGMVTPFEVQRFFFNTTDMFDGNPLKFPDETKGNLTPSKYQFGFMGIDDEDKYDEQKYGKKTEFIATAIGSLANGTPIAEVITSDKSPTFVGNSSNVNVWLEASIDFYVTARIPMKLAGRYYEKYEIDFPYISFDDKYIPESLDDFTLCDITMDMSQYDDQSTHCFMYYHAASRIHYGKNDWTDNQWIAHFGIPSEGVYFNNPMYETPMNPMNSKNLLGNLSDAWKGDNQSTISYSKSKVENLQYENGVWSIDKNLITDTYELTSDFENPLQTMWTGRVVLSDKSKENGWHYDDSGNIVNEGQIETANIKYVRVKDPAIFDVNKLHPGGSEIIEKEQFAAQNESVVLNDDAWTKQFSISNLSIFDRNKKEHSFFDAKLGQRAESVEVSRNFNTPTERVSEIATLLGKIPGNATHWSLSYLAGNRMVPIASSESAEIKSKSPYNIVEEIDVNTLQGNTSFFLTYGLDDAAGDVYYKQLDVHIGELLDPSEKRVVQSMYGNVSVQFPENAFESQTDVTVRVASLSDYNYNVFEGLHPVGTIVEVLPSHVFNQGDANMWPRVSIEITRESLGDQNPLDVKIYKPDFQSKTVVPLENQEIGFYFEGNPIYSCAESSGNLCKKPENDKWDAIRVSGKTPTFSVFMLMDENQASLIKSTEASKNVPEFVCEEGSSYVEANLWAGLVNGYLKYPYPCVGESNYMLQLRKDGAVVAERQGLAVDEIIWDIRENDILTQVTFPENMDTRLSLYGGNGKNLQIGGPSVRIDRSLPVIEDAFVEVEDYELQKKINVDAILFDAESGIDSVVMDFHWAGKLVERRVRTNTTVVDEEFLLTKKMAGECVGCKLEVVKLSQI